jgi:hypothetical protein
MRKPSVAAGETVMMNRRLMSFLSLAFFTGMLVLGRSPVTGASAQDAPVDPEVLARGPMHEAFAAPATSESTSARLVAKEPPEPIEEMLPEMKPAGDKVAWVPGYWNWDAETANFVWISGVWRAVPPGRTWIPGNWQKVDGGWQWTAGYWGIQDAKETVYLPPPPKTLERGPTSPAPDANATYVPGSWVYLDNRYVWQAGSWITYKTVWVRMPASYRKTPAGYVFVPGYWDQPLISRGVLFAPVRFANVSGKKIVYRPTYAIRPDFLLVAPPAGKNRLTDHKDLSGMQSITAGEKRLLEQEILRYKILTRARAEAEAKLAGRGAALKEPYRHKWDLPTTVPGERPSTTPAKLIPEKSDKTKAGPMPPRVFRPRGYVPPPPPPPPIRKGRKLPPNKKQS